MNEPQWMLLHDTLRNLDIAKGKDRGHLRHLAALLCPGGYTITKIAPGYRFADSGRYHDTYKQEENRHPFAWPIPRGTKPSSSTG